MSTRIIYRKNTHFLSCDWGTSSFRLLLAGRDSGEVAAALSSANGAKEVYGRWKEQKKVDQTTWFLRFLEEKIGEMERQVSADLSEIPVIVSGMASSTIGIKSLPYSPVPLDLARPRLQYERFSGDEISNPVLLVSGVSTPEDVMRGEEVQLMGLHRVYGLDSALYLLPGTHSKHLFVEKGKLTGFRTYMTGEIYQIIGTHSILQAGLDRPKKGPDRESFLQGVREAREGNLLNSLFAIRARELVGSPDDPASRSDYLSGLLIGTELRDLSSAGEVIVSGGSSLQAYYTLALEELGIPFRTDPDPARRTLDGHLQLLPMLE